MYLRRNGRSSGSTDRGQTAVLGVVLLIGMVATISLSFFLVAGETVTTVEHQAEEERVEGVFVELSQQMHTVSSNDDTSRTMDLDIGQNGAVVREETGSISVTSDALEDDSIDDLSIGTIEYESEDGTVLAYEAGAVFRENGNETQVVSSPSIHYDVETGTLTLPVVTATGEERLGSGDVTFAHGKTKTFDNADVVEGESVEITIESDYYRGWEAFFRNRAGDAAVRNVDHENQTVEVQVGYLDVDSAFDTGATLSGTADLHPGDGKEGDEEDIDDVNLGIVSGQLYELDDVIEQMVDDRNTSENREWADGGSLTMDGTKDLDHPDRPGDRTYYAEEIQLQDDLTVDLSDGNATIVVDGDVDLNSHDLTVKNWDQAEDHTLKIYLTGDLDTHDGNLCVDPCDASNIDAAQLQVYGTSETNLDFRKGNEMIEGIFYVASNGEDYDGEFQVNVQGSIDFYGAIVASSINRHNSDVNMEYDSSLQNEDIDIYPNDYERPPNLTYLNVAKHEVVVEQD